MNRDALDAELLAAHSEGDLAALIEGYLQATALTEDADRAGFYLTHAWIFALEAGDPRADDIKAQLVAQGREVAT